MTMQVPVTLLKLLHSRPAPHPVESCPAGWPQGAPTVSGYGWHVSVVGEHEVNGSQSM
jgi:hypothetical protein